MGTVVDVAAPSMLEDDVDPEVRKRRRARRRRAYLVALAVTVPYYGFAILFYMLRGKKPCPGASGCGNAFCQKWNVADAIYFATVTMTTVGYGDLKPETLADQYVTIVFILFGFIVRGASARSPRCCTFACTAAPVLVRARCRARC